MKRSFKIIATLLTLCLLIGIAATVAFAAETDIGDIVANQLKLPSADSYAVAYDYGSNSAGNSSIDNTAVDLRGNPYIRYYASGSTQINADGSFALIRTGDSNNKKVGSYGHVKDGVTQYDYAVIDLDFGTDRYRVKVGYKLNTTKVTVKSDDTEPKTQTTTYTYAIVPAYALYTEEELTRENIEADIKATYDALVKLREEEDHGCELTTSIVMTTPTGGTATTKEYYDSMYNIKGIDLDDLSVYEMTYDDAIATKELALYSGDQVYVMARYWKDSTAGYKSFNLGINFKQDKDGVWGFYDGDNKVADMSNEIGKYDHITFVIKYTAPAEGETVGKTFGAVFVNGEYVKESSEPYITYSFGIQEVRLTLNGAAKTHGGHSYAFTNCAANYYKVDENSGDSYGIHEYMTSGDYKTKSITECADVVYTNNYVSPNGYVRINTALGKGTPVSHPELVAAELAKIKDGCTLYTTMDVLDLDVPEGVEKFKIECGADVNVTLSAAATENRFALEKKGNVYTVFKDNSDITVYLKWLDIKGNHITTTSLLYGEAPDASGIFANSVDESASTIYYATVSGWTWDLEGEVGTVTSDMAAAGSTITMTPVVDGEISSVTGASFYMGVRYDDTLVTVPVPASDKTFTKYKNATALTAIREAKAQTYGNTLVLLSDFTGEDGDRAPLNSATGAQTMTAGTTINFDFNGHTFVKEGYADTFGNDIFRISEGCSVNVYSTKPGGKLVMGNLRPVKAENIVSQSAGIANVSSGVNEASFSIGDIIGADGSIIAECGDNFTYIGANVLVANGEKQTDSYDANTVLKDDKKITVNMNGGYYYAPFRTSYALICIKCPDVVINVDGITIVNAHQSSSGLFSDYKEFAANTVATVKNSKIYSMQSTEDASGNRVSSSASSIINILHADSYAYFENCVLVGELVSRFSGTVEIGPGNTIVNYADISFENNSKIKFSDGTSYVIPSNYPFSNTVKHPYANSKWAHDLDITLSADAEYEGDVDTNAEAAYITSVSFKTEAYTVFVDVTYSGNVSIITYNDNNVPDSFADVEWRTAEGELVATTKELIGTSPIPPKEVVDTVGKAYTYKWFIKGFNWSADSGLVVKEGTNVFTPTPFYTASIRGIKANVTLFEDVVYNLYLPVSDMISDISVSGAILGTATVTVGGEEYYVVSSKLAVNEFAPTTCTVSFKAMGESLSQTLTLDLLAYATVVSESYACGSEEATLVYQMLSYKNAVAKFADETYTSPENLEEFMNAHTDCACAGTAIELSEAELSVDYSPITEKGISSIAYVLSLGDIGMAIYTDSATVDSVSYTDDCGRQVLHTAANGNLILRDGYYLVTGVSAAHINNIMTITVDGAEGTYSLGKYIVNNPDVKVAEDLYKYALASEDYKYIRESESDKKVYNKMQSVLLMGQSNMTSSNDLTEAIQIEDDRLFMMRDNEWVKMKEPIHTGSSLYGAGIGATFGKAFVETFDVNLGLIPAAKGGTTLEKWAVGGDLYNNAVAMAKAAQETSEICAILWHQGEGDQNNENYAALLQVIFDQLIEDLGLDPDKIVIITGELYGTRSDAVHMPQLIELGKHYKNYGIALSDGLTVRDERTHFDAPSMRVFGYRYFDLFYNLITGKHYYFNQDPSFYKAIDEE